MDAFLAQVQKDPVLRQELCEAQLEAIARVAHAHSFELSDDDLKSLLAPLTEEELAQHAGGIVQSRYEREPRPTLFPGAVPQLPYVN